MYVEVWGDLSGNDAIVLNQVDSVRTIGPHERFRRPNDRVHDCRRFLMLEVQNGRSVTLSQHLNLAQFVLFPVDERQCLVCFLDERLF